MATATAPAVELGGDRWVSMPATWEIYLRLLEARGERRRPKYTFLDGRLTAVTTNNPHEMFKTRIGGFIEDVLVGLRIPFCPAGEVTLRKSEESRQGTEADETYFLNDIDRVRGQKILVMGRDPAPDLVVEVVVSHPADDALEAYRRFGVREVWVCKEKGLEFLVLGADGRYAASPVSAALPFLASDELAPWLYGQETGDEADVRHRFRLWVAETLAPRRRAEG